ncbi:MAG: 6-phosphogluconolactonase [Candidatus Woesearchaeota archaeon]|jgi:6-phosphogluconolactonase|nr:6-phosphogluconolactonase [Candidatus Woesearchaeota archaeon]
MTKIILRKNKSQLYESAANIIEKSVKKLLKKQKTINLAIPGGRSVPGIFKKLKNKPIEWNKIHIFMVDERLVPITHKDSNFKLAKQSFLNDLIKRKLLQKQNIHPFILNKKKDKGTLNYKSELIKHNKKFDIILLSSGEDGHVGALYPHHHSIKNNSKFFIAMNDSPKPPPKRMSLSKTLLKKSKVAIILFLGPAKREAFIKFKNKNTKVINCPAKLINSIKESYALTNLR